MQRKKCFAKWRSSKKRRVAYCQQLISRPNRLLRDQTKEIQGDFTKLAITLITQNKNLVKDIVNIYHIVVNSYQTLMPVSQKKIVNVVALLLTHAIVLTIATIYTTQSKRVANPCTLNYKVLKINLQGL